MSKKILWLTTSSMNIEPVIGSLEAAEFDIDIEHYRYDHVQEGTFFDEDLTLKVGSVRPDLVFYIGSLEGPYMARSHVYHNIQEICPIVNIVFDGGCPFGWPALKKFREDKCFSVVVNIDGNQDWPKGENDMTTLCPIDPRPYAKVAEKSIPFGFYGGSTSDDRAELLKKLKELKLIETAERDERLGSYQAYADFMLKCRMVLNMAKTGSGKTSHVKARVIESGLARACLLEPKDSPAKNWFKPGIDYLEYSSVDQLEDLVLSLDAADMQDVAESLHKKVITDHSPEKFYRKIFEKVGLEV